MWDSSAVAALDRVGAHFRRRGTQDHITGLNEPGPYPSKEPTGPLANDHRRRPNRRGPRGGPLSARARRPAGSGAVRSS